MRHLYIIWISIVYFNICIYYEEEWTKFVFDVMMSSLWYFQIFSSNWPDFFSGKHLIHFLVLKMRDFWNFVLHNCILVFDAEQVYLKLQIINLKNKELEVANPKPQTLEKNLELVFQVSKNLNPKP